jgi:hypothetical protein
MKKYSGFLLGAVLAVLALASVPSDAQVPAGLLRFGTTGAYAPQTGNCLSILAMNSSGQVATDSGMPCATNVLTAAYTNATAGQTTIMTLPAVAAGAPVVRGECKIIWQESNTGATPSFAVQMNNAPTALWVVSSYSGGAYVAPGYYTITTTTQTAVTPALTTTAANTAYVANFALMLSPGAAAGPITITISGQSSGGFTLTVQPGSNCEWGV